MKKNIFTLFLSLAASPIFLNYVLFAQNTETITVSTYYPSPHGVYKTLRLYPNKDFDPNKACSSKGNMSYNDSDGHVYVCDGNRWSNSAMPLIVYTQDKTTRTIENVTKNPTPFPTLDENLILKIPVKAQDVVKVNFYGMFKGPGYTGIWLTSKNGELLSGWLPTSYLGVAGNEWVPVNLTAFWRASEDGILVFQQGYYMGSYLSKNKKENSMGVSGRFAFAEKVHLEESLK